MAWSHRADALAHRLRALPFELLAILGGITASIAIWFAVVQYQHHREAEAVTAVEVVNVNLTHTLREHVVQVFRELDLQTVLLAENLRRNGIRSVNAAEHFRRVGAELPYVRRISVLDKDGFIVSSSAPSQPGSRASLKHFAVHAGADIGGIYIGNPQPDRTLGDWQIPVSRRLNDTAGRFAGVVFFAFDPAYLGRQFATMDLGENASVMLVRNDGIVLASAKNPKIKVGDDISKTPGFNHAGAAGFFVGSGKLDGHPRIVAYDHLSKYPLYVHLATSLEEALRPARAEMPAVYYMATAITFFLILASVTIAWLFERQSKAAGAATEAKKQAESLLAENRALTADLERRVAARTADLERMNRELDAFGYTVSHDLRAPLRAVEGFAAILENEATNLDDRCRQLLGRISGGAKRMSTMIDDLLRLSRVSRGGLSLAQVDLGELVSDVLEILRAAYPSTEVTVASLPRVCCDAGFMREVFQNLIGNALKYSAKKDLPEIEIGMEMCAGESAFFVRDNGAGFDMTYAGKLFGVFQRFHPAREFPGNGVGLAIAKGIIERHGGRIWAQSAPDAGATFYFTLGQVVAA
jgi:signal transduction histidine kinase